MFQIKPFALSVLAAALLLPALLNPSARAAATGPTIDKSSVMIWLSKRGLYYPKPGQSDDSQWSWLPNLDFKVNGPIEAGTQFVVEYWIGKTPFITVSLASEAEPAGAWYKYDRVGSMVSDEKASVYTGPVAVTIRAVNELSGLNQWLYKGIINVKKYNPLDPAKFPAFKNKFDYYVDQDWRMAFGSLTGNWYESNYGSSSVNPSPYLIAKMWFRDNQSNLDKTQAHLFYQGQDIARADGSSLSWSTTETSAYNWALVSFPFTANEDIKPVFYYDTSGSHSHPGAFFLNEHPGDYEIKVLHQGKLSRSLKFSVGKDGRIVDNGFSTQLQALDQWTMPVKVMAQTDGNWDLNAWKTGAYYANPLTGFTL